MKPYALCTATPEDAKHLFDIKIAGMQHVSDMLRTDDFDYEKEFSEYLQKFEPEKIQVIVHDGKDVGRLRVVRTPESIYIGGIQLLPEYQGKGIGKAIFSDIIAESESAGIPIDLEVHHVNESAIAFYKKLGFEDMGETEAGNQMKLRYLPNKTK